MFIKDWSSIAATKRIYPRISQITRIKNKDIKTAVVVLCFSPALALRASVWVYRLLVDLHEFCYEIICWVFDYLVDGCCLLGSAGI